jgi:hypothetical protein
VVVPKGCSNHQGMEKDGEADDFRRLLRLVDGTGDIKGFLDGMAALSAATMGRATGARIGCAVTLRRRKLPELVPMLRTKSPCAHRRAGRAARASMAVSRKTAEEPHRFIIWARVGTYGTFQPAQVP